MHRNEGKQEAIGAGDGRQVIDYLREHIIGSSPAIVALREMLLVAARSDANIVITGPSGSGKELVAKALHHCSKRRDGEFIAVNSGAIPENLAESELFGHEKGSFTGADRQHIGHFERANKGTIFLDEIGEMSQDMQVRLLRILEEKALSRVGGKQKIAIDTRLIVATHRNLEMAMMNGDFREDLYYRMAVITLDVPALTARKEDIPHLVQHFMSRGFAADNPPRFSRLALDMLSDYDWPGNVRELRNLVERAAVFFPGSDVGRRELEILMRRMRQNTRRDDDYDGRGESGWGDGRNSRNMQNLGAILAAADKEKGQGIFGNHIGLNKDALNGTQNEAGQPLEKLITSDNFTLSEYMREEEMKIVQKALEMADGVVAKAARMVNMRRTSFFEKMKRYNIDRDGLEHNSL